MLTSVWQIADIFHRRLFQV